MGFPNFAAQPTEEAVLLRFFYLFLPVSTVFDTFRKQGMLL